MTDSQPWWARPGGAAPGAAPGQAPPPGQPPTGGQPAWNPNPTPAQANPYGAPQQPYSPTPQQYGAPPQQQYGAPPQQQYGAPPQQQYGGPQQQQYGAPQQGGFGQPDTANPYQSQGYPGNQGYSNQNFQGYGDISPSQKSSSKGLLIGGLVLVAVLIVGGGVLGWIFLGGKELDVKQAEAGVQEILSDPINGYGSNDVTSVTCNDGNNPKVKTNGSFTCQVEINGHNRNVNVEFTDDEGTYAVDGPR